MATIKVISFIILALTVSCSREEKLKKALDSINPLLLAYTEFDGSDATIEVTSFLNKVLELSPEVNEQPWLNFLIGSESESKDIKARGDQDLTEDVLKQRALKSIDEAYPDMESEKFQENNHKWHQADKGYLTFLPYVLNGYSNLVRRYYIKQLFELGKRQSEAGKNPASIAVQNDADAEFSVNLMNRIRQYIQYYTARQIHEDAGVTDQKELHQKSVDLVNFVNKAEPQKRYNIGTKEDAERVKNANQIVAVSNKESSSAHKTIQNSLQNNHSKIYMAYFQIRNFQTSIPYFLNQVIEYLNLYAEEAPREQIETIVARIKDLTLALYITSKFGKNQMTIQQYIDTFIYNAAKSCQKKDQESEHFRRLVAPKIYQAWLEVIAKLEGRRPSLLAARKLTRQCLPQPLAAIGENYVYKKSLVEYPLTGKNSNSLEDALIAWDFLYELSEKDNDQANVEWWNVALKNFHQIFDVDSQKLAVMLWSKRLFNYHSFEGEQDTKMMKALYKLVLKFAQHDVSEVVKERTPEKVLAFLEANPTEFADQLENLKLHILRSIPKKQLI